MCQAKEILQLIHIDEFSVSPKYMQLSNSILDGIRKNIIQKNDLMPSINDVSFEFEISRVTVERGYNYLKSIGVLKSVAGRGYFIKSTEVSQNFKVFLLFNKLSVHKKMVYDSFVETLGPQASIDFYVYNNDFALFKKLIENRKDHYTHYVILPHFFEGGESAHEVIDTLKGGKIVLLDKLLPNIKSEFGAVYENFSKDLFLALTEGLEALKKYHKMVMVFPEASYFPKEILNGFQRFCHEFAFEYQVVSSLENHTIEKGEVYINLMEDDLVVLIERIIDKDFKIGKEIGVISYNETPLKRFILNGLTTISTDFVQMGKSAAELILKNASTKIENPFYLTLRKSL
jgi:DNA-binding transcriptional regulator YhcF (GntR family)